MAKGHVCSLGYLTDALRLNQIQQLHLQDRTHVLYTTQRNMETHWGWQVGNFNHTCEDQTTVRQNLEKKNKSQIISMMERQMEPEPDKKWQYMHPHFPLCANYRLNINKRNPALHWKLTCCHQVEWTSGMTGAFKTRKPCHLLHHFKRLQVKNPASHWFRKHLGWLDLSTIRNRRIFLTC
jgi:hypothetical protein